MLRILIPIIACLVLVGCEKKQEVETRPDHLFTQCDGSQLRLPEGALYSSVIREHTDGCEIQLRNGRYFYVQENPLEYLGITSQPCKPETLTRIVPCPPCRDYCCEELKKLRKENWQLQRDNWQLHSQLTRLELSVDTVYAPEYRYPEAAIRFIERMPKGRWMNLHDFLLYYLPNKAAETWSDSVFILSKPGEE